MSQRVYVLDTETTGLSGCAAGDHVVDVGVVSVDLDEKLIDIEYSEIVGYDTSRWDNAHKRAWIFQHSDLTLEKVRTAKPLEQVISELRRLLWGQLVTSYNTSFDLDRFLLQDPWNLSIIRCQDIMATASYPVFGNNRWPRLDVAYHVLCPSDPAHMNGPQTHRALSDAIQAAFILLRLYRDGDWSLSELSEAEPYSREAPPCGGSRPLEGGIGAYEPVKGEDGAVIAKYNSIPWSYWLGGRF